MFVFSPASSLDDVIQQLQMHLKKEVYEIQVCRYDILRGLIKETDRANFDPMKRITVKINNIAERYYTNHVIFYCLDLVHRRMW